LQALSGFVPPGFGWRGDIVASIPKLAGHSRTPEGNAIPEYLTASNLRFQQWIFDTCLHWAGTERVVKSSPVHFRTAEVERLAADKSENKMQESPIAV
jgi:hypothetical protein